MNTTQQAKVIKAEDTGDYYASLVKRNAKDQVQRAQASVQVVKAFFRGIAKGLKS